MKVVLKTVFYLYLLVYARLAFSYEVRTHEALTKEALKNSIDGTDTITTLGLKIGQQLPNPISMV
jgi:hypothetical protein